MYCMLFLCWKGIVALEWVIEGLTRPWSLSLITTDSSSKVFDATDNDTDSEVDGDDVELGGKVTQLLGCKVRSKWRLAALWAWPGVRTWLNVVLWEYTNWSPACCENIICDWDDCVCVSHVVPSPLGWTATGAWFSKSSSPGRPPSCRWWCVDRCCSNNGGSAWFVGVKFISSHSLVLKNNWLLLLSAYDILLGDTMPLNAISWLNAITSSCVGLRIEAYVLSPPFVTSRRLSSKSKMNSCFSGYSTTSLDAEYSSGIKEDRTWSISSSRATTGVEEEDDGRLFSPSTRIIIIYLAQ